MRMKKRHIGSRKFNNGGMSLIEVIVAIVVLSIAVIPIMYTFVYSIKHNAQARERQRAIAAAQTIMENFKANSVVDIDAQFSSGSFPVGTGTGTTYTATGDLPRTYTISGIEYESAQYNATITLNEHGGDSAHSLTKFTDMNPYTDAVYQSDLGIDALADSKMLDEVLILWNAMESTPETPVAHDVTEIDERKVEITEHTYKIEAVKAADGSDEVYITDIYKYILNDFKYIDPSSGVEASLNKDDFAPVESNRRLIYTNKDTRSEGAALKYIYLYFYPGYQSSWNNRNPNMKEYIAVENSTGTQLNFYAIKQKNPVLSDTYLNSGEMSYEVDVTLGDKIIMHDNLRINLFSGASGENGASVMLKYGNDSISPLNGLHCVTGSSRTSGLLESPAPTATPDPVFTATPARLIYDIEIVVEGASGGSAGKELARLKGTIIE